MGTLIFVDAPPSAPLADGADVPALGVKVGPPRKLGDAPAPARRPLEVEPGFAVRDITTIEECDLARAILVDAIQAIEGQIDAAETRAVLGEHLDLQWKRRAEGALRAKSIAIDEVEIIRKRLVAGSRIAREAAESKAVLAIVKELDPVVHADAVTAARQRGLVG